MITVEMMMMIILIVIGALSERGSQAELPQRSYQLQAWRNTKKSVIKF